MSQGLQKILADEEVDTLSDSSFGKAVVYYDENGQATNNSCLQVELDNMRREECKPVNSIVKKYFNATEIIPDVKSYKWKYLSSGDKSFQYPWGWAMHDGSIVYFDEIVFEPAVTTEECNEYKESHNSYACTESFTYIVDVNGLKGPNQYGRDLFYFSVDSQGRIWSDGHDYRNWRDDPSICGEPNKPISGNVDGSGCAARIIDNGWKMDY